MLTLRQPVQLLLTQMSTSSQALAKQRHCMKASVTEQRADGLDADLSQESALKTELALVRSLATLSA